MAKHRITNPWPPQRRWDWATGWGIVSMICVAAVIAVPAWASSHREATSPAATALANPGALQLTTTTALLADIVSQVAGEHASVSSLIPPGKDPHDFEPSLRTIRHSAHSHLIFAHGLLLEPHSLMETVRHAAAAPVIELGDHAVPAGAQLLPAVADSSLDALWLGLRVAGVDPAAVQQLATVDISLIDAHGPGEVTAYTVGTFGTPQLLLSTAATAARERSTSLPANAHTHISWAFSQPGHYELTFGAQGLAPTTFYLTVGVPPPPGRAVVDSGHVDITADMNSGFALRDGEHSYDPAHTTLVVPSSVLHSVPADPAYRFLGRPGEDIYLLPQAVLGAHIHGEVDPHLWHNPSNTIAMVEVIIEQLSALDPSNGHHYRSRGEAYITQLRQLDADIAAELAQIPPQRRNLISTHHGYAYLDQAYGIRSAGYISANPSIEPAPRDIVALQRTLSNLQIPAVFIEPGAQGMTETLRRIAQEQHVDLCPIYSDTFDDHVTSYIELMTFNAQQLRRCLGQPGNNQPGNYQPGNTPPAHT